MCGFGGADRRNWGAVSLTRDDEGSAEKNKIQLGDTHIFIKVALTIKCDIVLCVWACLCG